MNNSILIDNLATARHWQSIGGIKRYVGITIPLFSLRTQFSFGIGRYLDLIPLIDWLSSFGINVLQLLPVNDLGEHETSPFNAMSAMALNPDFISIDQLRDLKAARLAINDIIDQETLVSFPRLPSVEYPVVRAMNNKLFRRAFELFYENEYLGNSYYAAKLNDFIQQNQDWIVDYAVFRHLKVQHNWWAWKDWEEQYSPELVQKIVRDEGKAILFYQWLQWIAFDQFKQVHDYAAKKGVLIFGDIPFLVNRESADVWAKRQLFKIDQSAGAPPDQFSTTGQNWGMPVMNWEVLEKDNYNWWRRRLAYAENFYDIFRIDHVLGLFRIWSIPVGAQSALEGAYDPANEKLWGEHGRRILQMMLSSTRMLPIGEDLGVVQPVVRQVLAEMGIPGYKVERWEKEWLGDKKPLDPGQYPVLSLATTSVHDSETLQGWWLAVAGQEDKTLGYLEREHYLQLLGLPDLPSDAYSDSLHEALLQRVLSAASIFAIFPLSDVMGQVSGLFGDDHRFERINTPGTVGEHNWSWRLPVSIEKLRLEPKINLQLKKLTRKQIYV